MTEIAVPERIAKEVDLVVTASNPFSTRYTKPGALRYRFHDQQAVEELLGCLVKGKANLIVGPHGTGKTTLLQSLLEVLNDTFPSVCILKLDGVYQGWRSRIRVAVDRLRRIFSALQSLPRESLLILDGVEQLGFISRQIILQSASVRRVTVLATSHRPMLGMQVVHQTTINSKLIRELLDQLLKGSSEEMNAKVEAWIANDDLDQILNLREFWFELYDLVQPDLIRGRL